MERAVAEGAWRGVVTELADDSRNLFHSGFPENRFYDQLLGFLERQKSNQLT